MKFRILFFSSFFYSLALFSQDNALHFAGTGSNYEGNNDFISIPDNGSMDLGNNFSIETWIYLDDAVNNTIIDKGDYRYLFQTHSNGQTGLGLYNVKNGWVYSQGTIPINEWVHIAVTVDGGTVVFYLNGNVLSSHTGYQHPGADNGEISIGMQSPQSCRCNFFDGKMSELRVWSRTISQSQIQENMNGHIGPSGMQNLAAVYSFHQGSPNYTPNTDARLNDASGNNNHGTLTNFSLTSTKSNWVTGKTFGVNTTPRVTGHTVNTVEYANGTGRFIMDRTNVWREINSSGEVYNFRETGRNINSIYLLDDARNISIELNINLGQVFIFWDRPERVKLYDLSKAFNTSENKTKEYSVPNAIPAVSGLSVNSVEYANGAGRFIMDRTNVWREINTSGVVYNFRETGRNINSIYLLDDTRNISIELNIDLGQVFLFWERPERTKLYDLSKAFNTAENKTKEYTSNTPASAENTRIVEVPDMPPSDIQAVMQWIKNKTTSERLPFCWKRSQARHTEGLTTCPNGSEKQGLLCYTDCRPGYFGNGPMCYQKCPDGYTQTGVSCYRGPHTYSARSSVAACPDGYKNMGASCYNAKKVKSISMDHMTCPSGRFKRGGRCYVQCPDGYKNTGEFCHRDANSMQSDAYGRGAGSPMNCKDGLIHNGAGLCYEPCKEGFKASSDADPVCWSACPDGWVDCGAGCAQDKTECGRAVADQVVSVLELTANIASLGMSAPATGAANAAEASIKVGDKVMTSSTRVGRAMIKLGNKLKSARFAKPGTKFIKKVFNEKTGKVYEAGNYVKDAYEFYEMEAKNYQLAIADDFDEITSKEIEKEIDNRFGPKTAAYLKQCWGEIQFKEMAGAEGFGIAQDVLGTLSIADPTGVLGVVAAFTKPICQANIPFPSLTGIYK